MKRTLALFEDTADGATSAQHVRIGTALVVVTDLGDGTAAARFAELLAHAGGTSVTAETSTPIEAPIIRVSIRAAGTSPRGHAGVRAREQEADIVLGSVRHAFAVELARRLLGDSAPPRT